mmetsp:Transcript_51854/g.82713  ORF Transcript_51854/g.82713 Transcript_51854/m.82713 type:complete len:407 (-) Transcript_51854:162-1382(-)|eukprot:CAMPEP_0197036310 /NCGR_PEP_ID=MMETSP1384-20130603/13857_1 /TAXON_ID=29189 /ORGANISM="Ammonia sp." /LENGTH=406 /DNA_ID=CAMNT_0042466479 /DNA_START=195 /DNA_END=1415 /DNA_ORIENTATION=+
MSFLNQLQSIFGANLGPHPMYQMGAHPGVPQVFRRKYHAYSPAYWDSASENREKLEAGDKIVMPASALEELSRMHVQFPIMFEIAHDSDILPKKSHCSVMEFTAPEGAVYLPLWMIDNLGLDPQGDSVIELTTVSLPKGTFVQFQAHETKFAMLQNPRVVLEKNLRSYSCLTVGDTIQIEFADHIYKLDVTEVKPSIPRGNAPAAISIIETDIKVDFKEPRDYKEWEKKNKGKNFNHALSPKAESKAADEEEEEDDFGVIIDPVENAKSSKSGYFRSLEESGIRGQKTKKSALPSSPSSMMRNSSLGTANPYSSRGAPLGKTRGKALGTGSGKCEYHKPKFVDGQLAKMNMGHLIKQKSVRKEEEIVGSMRYIYEIDEHGNRTLVRRLPVREIKAIPTESAYSLKD